jgi:hypothetical protein
VTRHRLSKTTARPCISLQQGQDALHADCAPYLSIFIPSHLIPRHPFCGPVQQAVHVHTAHAVCSASLRCSTIPNGKLAALQLLTGTMSTSRVLVELQVTRNPRVSSRPWYPACGTGLPQRLHQGKGRSHLERVVERFFIRQ